ncbi:hypothetical protein LINPERPRIM_LOCUS28046, partial [Linum perenne]
MSISMDDILALMFRCLDDFLFNVYERVIKSPIYYFLINLYLCSFCYVHDGLVRVYNLQ